MFKKFLATFLPTITTLCRLSTIFIVSGLVVNNPLLVSPALAKATNYLKAIDFLYEDKHANEFIQVMNEVMDRGGANTISQEIKNLLNNKVISYGAGETFTIINPEVKVQYFNRAGKTDNPAQGILTSVRFGSSSSHSLKFTLRHGGYFSSKDTTVELTFYSSHGLNLKSVNGHIVIDRLRSVASATNISRSNLSAQEYEVVKRFFKEESGEYSLLLDNNLLTSPDAKKKLAGYIESEIDKYVPCDIYKICESTKIQPDPILPNISPVDVPQPKPPKPVRRILRF
jgi:hypothetical protein